MKFSTLAATLSLATSAMAAPTPKAAPQDLPVVSEVTDTVNGLVSGLNLPIVSGLTTQTSTVLQPLSAVLSGGLGLEQLLGPVTELLSGSDLNVLFENGALDIVKGLNLEGLSDEQGLLVLGGCHGILQTLGVDKILAQNEGLSLEGLLSEDILSQILSQAEGVQDISILKKVLGPVVKVLGTVNVALADVTSVAAPQVTKVTQGLDLSKLTQATDLVSTVTQQVTSSTQGVKVTQVTTLLEPVTGLLGGLGLGKILGLDSILGGLGQ